MFTLDLTKVKSAIVSAVLMAILAIAGYVLSVGDVFSVDYHALSNAGALAFLTGVVSLIKSMLTTTEGNFVGVVGVK